MGQNPFSAGEHTQPMSEINTTPLVDVMLVLLVIFIITAPLLTHAVKIDLPQATSQPLEEKPEVIDLAVDADGKLFWNDREIQAEALSTQMAEAAAKQNQPELQIRADKNTRYQVLAEVLAKAQTAGMKKVGFVSQPQP
ncbi:biopolymer transporter ExbD [Methylophilus medardicus]|uniref:Biopolymer transporter ExbD n=2 Tax=Methylophilus medardicus TaxID=2588534 RepID=A0A5B8CWG8_9PROT|nr:biopolymer transporter ExbD [Methylophilus medardicus]QDC45430.1 biopolymer transporter ExbD [Methylophilus medardicus]QDC50437.1 biopolymer transporter ExbD [Methylophilus medardicus]QDC54142.1 biopolymer transporter ExbD [Methylophilus medardicus]